MRDFISHLFSLAPGGMPMTIIMALATILCAIAGYYVTIFILRVVAIIVETTETDWDDDLINAPLLKALSQLAPAWIIDLLLPDCFPSSGLLASVIHIITAFYIIWVTVYAINTFLDNLLYAFSRRDKFMPYAVKGIFQMGKLIFIGMGVIIGISILVGKSPVAILTALGASAAILMLVFKDTIMGLVASVQLTANKMLRKGDWVIVPKHGANGEVIDITLTTIKIRNWDNSITTVPPYSLVAESFQNYQAMRESGARRVARSVFIDITSVGQLNDEKIEELRIDGKLPPLSEKTHQSNINLTLYRDYLERWIEGHPNVRTDLLYMVRQLDPTPSGLPLELYFFLGVTEWKRFEHLQSSILDHVYATAPLFGLRFFQTPTGRIESN
ncbi:MAG: mechanosensitive ion channel family protein [Muribaculaceae bacterium]|nr:mechanosensitive ion channel family protein [Muribaculaceae bacterium]